MTDAEYIAKLEAERDDLCRANAELALKTVDLLLERDQLRTELLAALIGRVPLPAPREVDLDQAAGMTVDHCCRGGRVGRCWVLDGDIYGRTCCACLCAGCCRSVSEEPVRCWVARSEASRARLLGVLLTHPAAKGENARISLAPRTPEK